MWRRTWGSLSPPLDGDEDDDGGDEEEEDDVLRDCFRSLSVAHQTTDGEGVIRLYI